jgi:hypothetical protein
MKVFISGPMTGYEDYNRIVFNLKEAELKKAHPDWVILNPAIHPDGLTHEEYMKLCFAMLDICDFIVVLPGWINSKGSKMEILETLRLKKPVCFPSDDLEKLVAELEFERQLDPILRT